MAANRDQGGVSADIFAGESPAALALALAQLAEGEPDHPVVIALTTAAEVIVRRRERHPDDDFLCGSEWHRETQFVELVTVLQRRRYPPNGDRAEWVRYGPTGARATR